MSEFVHRREQFVERLEEQQLAGAIISTPHNVMFLTGYSGYREDAPSVLLLSANRQAVVVAPAEALRPFPVGGDLEVRFYDNYPGMLDDNGCINLAREVTDILRLWRVRKAIIGVEIEHVPHFLIEFLHLKIADLEIADVADLLRDMRVIKDEAEIAALAEAARVAGVGQAAARRAVMEQRCEIEVAAEARRAIELELGEITDISLDVVCASSTSLERIGGLPTGKICEQGSVLVCDIAARVSGYWGDCCAAIAVGEASQPLRRMHEVLREALALAYESARPGVFASELDSVMRGHVHHSGFDCCRHTGHGIGVTKLERPIICPENDQPLQADMVIVLEPSAFSPGVGGIRLEQMVHITKSGARVLATHSLDL